MVKIAALLLVAATIHAGPLAGTTSAWLFPIHVADYWAITSAYGHRISPLLGVELDHNGIDIAAVRYAQVIAVADGVVVEHWPAPGTQHPAGGYFRGHPVMGGMITIDHGNGWATMYSHLSTSYIREGQRVRSGQVIARIGNTGRTHGTGHHLHFEIHFQGDPVNPLLYILDPARLR